MGVGGGVETFGKKGFKISISTQHVQRTVNETKGVNANCSITTFTEQAGKQVEETFLLLVSFRQ